MDFMQNLLGLPNAHILGILTMLFLSAKVLAIRFDYSKKTFQDPHLSTYPFVHACVQRLAQDTLKAAQEVINLKFTFESKNVSNTRYRSRIQ